MNLPFAGLQTGRNGQIFKDLQCYSSLKVSHFGKCTVSIGSHSQFRQNLRTPVMSQVHTNTWFVRPRSKPIMKGCDVNDLLSIREMATSATSAMSQDRSTSTNRRMSNSRPAASRHANNDRYPYITYTNTHILTPS